MKGICRKNKRNNMPIFRFFSGCAGRSSRFLDLMLQIVDICYTIFNRLCAKTHMVSLLTPSTQAGVFSILDFRSGILDRFRIYLAEVSAKNPAAVATSLDIQHSAFATHHFPPMSQTVESLYEKNRKRSWRNLILTNLVVGAVTVILFYLSLLATSRPVSYFDMQVVDRAIGVLESKGFEREAFILRHTTTFRSTDHWLNRVIFKENAYAATNFPFQIITLYPDFYGKAKDDTERAMILLHEAQHLQNANEQQAYAYVWKNRSRLGWTQMTYGATPTYIDVSGLTRENAPELFTCTQKVWNDCTENLQIAENGKRKVGN
jgi:hypothetical protein